MQQTTYIILHCTWASFEDFGAQGEHVEVVETREYVGDPAFCIATTQLVKVGAVVNCTIPYKGQLFPLPKS